MSLVMLLNTLKKNYLKEINKKYFHFSDFPAIKKYSVTLLLVNFLKHCGN